MINFNGKLTDKLLCLSIENRGFAYGDAVFETIKGTSLGILFWEDHYFRLMASMRILRMEIPMNFTLEFLEEEILKTLKANGLERRASRVKVTVFRDSKGLYTPESNEVGYLISAQVIEHESYELEMANYTVDIFKDFPIALGLLSTLKTNNRLVNVVGSVYAKENDLDNCILINTNKQVVEALNSNIFLVKGTIVKTPPILDGCIKGIIRKQIVDIVKDSEDLIMEEGSISPFELQRADELFLTNVIMGIRPITAYRKKTYVTEVAGRLVEELNKKAGF